MCLDTKSPQVCSNVMIYDKGNGLESSALSISHVAISFSSTFHITKLD